MTDDVCPKVELASQRERDALDPWVARVLLAFGREDALVTDESMVSDLLEIGGRPHRVRRGRKGSWLERPGDPAILEQNRHLLASVSAKLGVPVEEGDRIVDVARRVRACALG
ncbi:MAG: hypothetical protein KF850_10135 [Labilithrix sp.]|nr:hypothetical protein [Labilithrix sp.]MBX3212380.1 hypothetical protein [Labilithrix sp.]